jgi:hypothetical protein
MASGYNIRQYSFRPLIYFIAKKLDPEMLNSSLLTYNFIGVKLGIE